MDRQTYERALQRAHEERLVVSEPYQVNGYRSWTVRHPAPSRNGSFVRFDEQAHALTCTCEAGLHGRYCKHRAAVREWLIEEREREARRTQPAPAPVAPSMPEAEFPVLAEGISLADQMTRILTKTPEQMEYEAARAAFDAEKAKHPNGADADMDVINRFLDAVLARQQREAAATATATATAALATPEPVKHCEDCGDPCDADSRFCRACGTERDFKHGIAKRTSPRKPAGKREAESDIDASRRALQERLDKLAGK